jgi:hypothetical protein
MISYAPCPRARGEAASHTQSQEVPVHAGQHPAPRCRNQGQDPRHPEDARDGALPQVPPGRRRAPRDDIRAQRYPLRKGRGPAHRRGLPLARRQRHALVLDARCRRAAVVEAVDRKGQPDHMRGGFGIPEGADHGRLRACAGGMFADWVRRSRLHLLACTTGTLRSAGKTGREATQ